MSEELPPILKLLSGELRISVDTPREGDAILVGPQETAAIASLLSVVAKYGKFNEDGDGVWAGYEHPSENEVAHIGVKCANCMMWQGGSSCKLISMPVEAGGKCRFAMIPNGVVRKSLPSPSYNDAEISIHTVRALEFLDGAMVDQAVKSMKYTKPELRENIKRRIMAGSKGGRPGQWSARKAQLVAQEYRRAGGGYRGKPGGAQRSLKKWTRERWTTADGKPALRKGKMTRYLPAKAWKKLTPAQRRATIAKKLAGDKRGRQFVPNTSRAQRAGANVRNSRKSFSSVVRTTALNQATAFLGLFTQRKELGDELGSTIGKIVRTAVTRRSYGKCRGLSIIDGDGDGFVCNPVTGNDDLPLVGLSEVAKTFWANIIKDSANWADRHERESDKPIVFSTSSGDAETMLRNMAQRGFIVYKAGNGVKVIPPPEFRKRFLAIRALRDNTDISKIEAAQTFAVSYHIYHEGNDPNGPEKAFASAMLDLFAYDPLNDNLYSPYGERPNSYQQLKTDDVRKYAESIMPEFEGVEGGIGYLSDARRAPRFKKPAELKKYQDDLEYARLSKELEIFESVLNEVKQQGLYTNEDPRRKPDETINEDWFAILELHKTYGDEEIARLLNYEPSVIREFLETNGLPIKANEILDFKRSLEAKDGRKGQKKEGALFKPPLGERQYKAKPTIALADRNEGERIYYEDFVEGLKWMSWQDNQFRQYIPPKMLKEDLINNPRLARIVRGISPIRYEQIMGDTEIPGGSNSNLASDMGLMREYMKQYFSDMVFRSLEKGLPTDFAASLGIPQGVLNRLIFFLTRTETLETLQAMLDRQVIAGFNLGRLYKDLHWLGYLPLLKDMPNYKELLEQSKFEKLSKTIDS